MPTQRPHIPGLGDDRGLQLGIHIEIIIFDLALLGVLEQRVDLRRLKAGEGHIKVGPLEVGDEQGQLVLVPLAGDFVEGDVERLLLLAVHLHHHALHLGDTHVQQHLQPLVSAHDKAGGLVPDHRLHIAELLDGAFQLFIFSIPRLEVFPGIVVGGNQIRRVFSLDYHAGLPSQILPFRAWSSRSMTSSWGVAPPYSPAQFSLTIW